MHDFDEEINRKGMGSLKWDRFHGRDIIPMWVADMDFRAPPSVIGALRKQVEHGIFGYPVPPRELIDSIVSIVHRKYDWDIQSSWIEWLPGIVTGLNLACRAVGKEGDEVISMAPIYPPFLSAPRYSNRKLVSLPLNLDQGKWSFSDEELNQAHSSRSSLFLVCNPQNPTGRIFSRKELQKIANFCLTNDMIICSDEIHCDLLLEDLNHIPIATLSPEIADKTITLMAPSKTYNIPGLCCSFAIIPNPILRKKIQQTMKGIVPEVNLMGFTACLAAYKHGEGWLKELLKYLRENRDLVLKTVQNDLPGIVGTPIEATYLAWLDVRQLDLNDPTGFFEKHGVGLSDGTYFGTPGFLRLNFGCPRNLLQEGLNRMKKALAAR